MKKFSTLALTLLALGSVNSVWADTVTTDQLPSGYYKISSAASGTNQTKPYVFNNYFHESNSVHVTLMGDTDGDTNNYIWKIDNDGTSTTISIQNGEGTVLKRENGNKGSSTYATHTTLTPVTASSTFPTAVYFNEGLYSPGDSDGNHNMYDPYKALAYWQNTSVAACKWKLTQVDVSSKSVYTVTITGASDAYVTRTSTSEHAFSSGFFISDVALTESDLTASEVTGYEPTIDVDEENKTISVTYAATKALLDNTIASAKELLNTRGIGYPTTSSSAYSTLNSAITTAEAVTSGYAAASTTLEAAMTAYKKTTTDLQLPEDGKVYRIYALWKDGTKVYAVNDGLNVSSKYYTSGSKTTRSDNTDLWVMQKVGNYYNIASATGERLFYYLQGANSGKTLISDIYIKSCGMINFGALNLVSGTGTVRIVMKSDGSCLDQYSSYGSNTGTWCSEWYFEEVTDFAGQSVTFTASNDEKNYATINLPYASTIPTGVTAWKKGDVSDTEVNLTAYKNAGDVLPANTPVLLTSTSANTVNFAPAAYAAAEDTGFKGTLAKAAVTDEGAYILAKDGDVVKFFALDSDDNTVNANKAYLVISRANAQALSFHFDDTTTGIHNAAAADAANAPIFDLSGRRVTKALKGGIYLQNGKKFVK